MSDFYARRRRDEQARMRRHAIDALSHIARDLDEAAGSVRHMIPRCVLGELASAGGEIRHCISLLKGAEE
jgi:hypothetical protein